MTNNGLARLISVDFLVGAAGLVFAGGIAYNSLGAGIGANLQKNIRQDERIAVIEETQKRLLEAAAESRVTQDYQLQNQKEMRSDITRILNILEERPR